ncbi:MAG: DUF115 domain-containing protein [Treponema sp.]|jgi:hypothetical protein|nr:DUF115 domain-containing protein [Treponema sp.]
MIALHSRYKPQAEAGRYLDALSIPPHIRCFILIEPGLGYMIPLLSERFPGARIIALHVSASRDRGALSVENGNVVYWDPSHRLPAVEFVGRELEELSKDGGALGPGGEAFGPGGGAFGPGGGGFGPESIKIIEWRPSRDFYGDSYVKLLAAAAAAIRRFDAERRTLRAFGRRWFRNFFRNLCLLRYFPLLRDIRETAGPILVTGSGPSLEESLPLIKMLRERQNCRIIAASSSVMALLYRQIVPDFVVSTDGGGWALLHLYELFRAGGGTAGSLAVSLIAKLPSQCGGLPILGIADGSLWQGLILRGLGFPHLVLPQRGTVTATALDLALALGRGKIIIAGMDLDTRGIRTHARPYSFDRLWREGASRFRGEYSQSFFRQMAAREGGSYRIYAEWFASRLDSYGGRLYTLGSNNPLFAGLPRIRAQDLSVPMGVSTDIQGAFPPSCGEGPVPVRSFPSGNAVPRALDILMAALEDPNTRESIVGELAPLLLPGTIVHEKEGGREADRDRVAAAIRGQLESLSRLSGEI